MTAGAMGATKGIAGAGFSTLVSSFNCGTTVLVECCSKRCYKLHLGAVWLLAAVAS